MKKKILDESYYKKQWAEEKIYSYDPTQEKNNTFVIDTPPPTISGALHIGHLFSYTQTDILARFQRMQGKNVFYPMGWDNNGLPTERRVQNLYKITCDPSLSPSDELLTFEEILNRAHLKPEDLIKQNHKSTTKENSKIISSNDISQQAKKKVSYFQPISRETFIRICSRQTKEDQRQYEKLWRKLALSVDWSQTYETIGPHAQAIAQRAFVDLYHKGFVESRYTPVFWDTQFQTAVAQADMEDRKKTGFYYDIKFKVQGEGGEFIISTTRPELLPACVAVTAHPEDERYKKLFHKQALTPLFSTPVPILPSTHADPKKGTGILMVCTFGDREDVRFWEKHTLPLKHIISPDGFLKDIYFYSDPKKQNSSHKTVSLNKDIFVQQAKNQSEDKVFTSLYPDQANKHYTELKGLRVQQARKKVVKMLKETKYLVSDLKQTEQFVKFYEKGDFPLELLPARQWHIKILNYKKDLLEQGRKVLWYPPSMLKRYEQWVEGLNQDWCISRQRFFGVPFPIWYPLDKNKVPDYNNPILPSIELLDGLIKRGGNSLLLNIDPMSSAPADWDSKWEHWSEDQRGQVKGFIADTDVMDTWATSSLTPQINSHWGTDEERHKKLFPADLRPQAHEIIRTWAFYTIVQSFFHSFKGGAKGDTFKLEKPSELKKQDTTLNIPWKNIAVSGWVMDPERLKISKSKSKKNTLSPEELIEEYSADAIRYWAGKARLGMDTVFDENMFKTGKKLIVKLNNAFKFVQIQIKGRDNFLADYFSTSSSQDRFKSSTDSSSADSSSESSSASSNKSSSEDLFTASKDFVFPGFEKSLSNVSIPIDQAWLIYLLDTHYKATSFLKEFHYSKALDLIEKSFWLFCDNYLELVKGRAYIFTRLGDMDNTDKSSALREYGSEGAGTSSDIDCKSVKRNMDKSPALREYGSEGAGASSDIDCKSVKRNMDKSPALRGGSAVCVLDMSMYLFIKMFAPYMPYITEHIWSQRYAKGRSSSVHRSSWGDRKVIIQTLQKKLEKLVQEKSLQKKAINKPSSEERTKITLEHNINKPFDSNKLLDFSFNLLEQIRNNKAEQKKSLSAPVKQMRIKLRSEDKILFDMCKEDIAYSSNTQPENILIEEAQDKELKNKTPKVFITL